MLTESNCRLNARSSLREKFNDDVAGMSFHVPDRHANRTIQTESPTPTGESSQEVWSLVYVHGYRMYEQQQDLDTTTAGNAPAAVRK